MARCPDCGGNLSEISSNFLRCDGCGKMWWKKDRAISEEKPTESPASSSPVRGVAGAGSAPAKEASEEKREAKVEKISEQKSSDSKSAEQREIEELRARLQAMEERTAAQESRRSDTKAKRGKTSFKDTPAYDVAKKWGLKVILPIFLILIALITLLSCFCGLRGIYVNVDNPNEFYSFSATKYEYHGTLFGEEYVDKGTWKKSDGKLELTYKDEFFGKITDSYEFSIKDSYKTITVTDDFGIEREYKRVSLMAYSTPQKVTVKFHINDGSDNADKKRIDLGARVAEPEAPVRNGYEFMGWYTDKEGWRNGEGEQFSENDRVWEKTEYYANWKNATIFTLTGEILVSPLEFTEGDNIETAYLRARGWNSLPEGVLRLIFKDSDGNEINGKSAPAANVSVVVVYDVRIVDGTLQYVNPALKEYVIPAEVNVIASGAFDGCTALEKIYITSRTSSLTVQSGAFEDCEKLTSIEGYDDTTAMKALIDVAGITRATVVAGAIVSWAFEGCSSLTSVTINDDVTSIGSYAFYGCTGLTSVTIGNSVTSIGDYAFNNCTGLTSVYYTGDIAGWCGISFGNSIANPLCYAGKLYIDGQLVTDLVIPDSVTKINAYAFYNCSMLTSVTIGNSVESIGESAFEDCTGLTSVTIPDSVTSIGSYAFSGCTAEIIWGENPEITSIGNNAFSGYKGNLIVIPDSVTSIGDRAFYDCTGLTSLTIPDSVTSIGSYAFYNCTGLTSVTIPDSVTSIGSYAFYNCTGLTSVTIPDSVTSIGYSAFYGCTGLTSVTIPDSVTSIGEFAFEDCTGLTSVTIGNSVESIGSSAFYGCTGLTSVTIPDSVTSIGSGAFCRCTGLTSVTIPDSVTSIGSSAFYGCTGLTSVVFEDTEGWQVSASIFFSSYTSLSSADLANTSAAATYLRSTYWNDYWRKVK